VSNNQIREITDTRLLKQTKNQSGALLLFKHKWLQFKIY